MPIQPVTLSQMNSNSFFLNLFLMGGWGSGKTVFSLGSQTLRTLHCDIDTMGYVSAKSFMGNPQFGNLPIRQDLISWQPINSTKEMWEVIDYIEKNWKNYDLIVVDTITDLQRLHLNEIRGKNIGYQLKDHEWGPVLYLMEQVTQRLKRIPIHTIFNGHETDHKRIIDGYVKFTPAFDGQFLDTYANHFTEIWRYVTVNQYYKNEQGLSQCFTHRNIQTQTDETFSAKSRVSFLDKWEPPNLDYILSKIYYHLTNNGIQQNGTNTYQ